MYDELKNNGRFMDVLNHKEVELVNMYQKPVSYIMCAPAGE